MKVESFQPKEKIVPIPDGSSFFILGKKNWYVKKKYIKIAQMMVANNYNFSDLRPKINLANVHLVSELPATTSFIIITSPTSSSSSSY